MIAARTTVRADAVSRATTDLMGLVFGAARRFNQWRGAAELDMDVNGVLTRVTLPGILPPHVPSFAVTFDASAGLEAVEGVDLPPELDQAVPSRRAQFLAGRYCAARALESLGVPASQADVARGVNGAPLWPPGVTGSITHTAGRAWAAVAWQHHVAAVGIDVERIMPETQAQRVARAILLPEEVERMPRGFTRDEWTTLVFSAKESLFKCLHPVVGRYFHYPDAEVVSVAAETGTFKIALHRDLSERFSAGTILRGRYDIRGGLAHTAVVIARR